MATIALPSPLALDLLWYSLSTLTVAAEDVAGWRPTATAEVTTSAAITDTIRGCSPARDRQRHRPI
jgi:hypothetical protein